MNSKLLVISILISISFLSSSYSQNIEKTHSFKYNILLPDYVKLQFAGGIGVVSPGIGYTFFNHKLDISLFYGYIPEYFTADDLHSVSLQFTLKFLNFKVSDNIEILPLNFGMFTHHTFGNEFWVKLPDNYPEGYYWWSPGINTGMFIGGEIKTKLLANKTPASGLAFYVRVGSRGLYVASKFGNSTIPMKDIIELGFGVAFYR